MRKFALSTLVLLGVVQVQAGQPKERPLNLAETKYDNVQDHLVEYTYNFDQITTLSIQEITEFWQNKTDGDYCIGLFTNILESYDAVLDAVGNMETLIDEYNTNCADKCLPGYVRCYGDSSNKCILECDCCALNQLSCCDSNNHPESTYNYATGENQVLHCYDWCCQDEETYCNDLCIPDVIGMPYGHGPYVPGVDGYGDPINYPKVCCDGQDCCDVGETFIDYLTQSEPFCCSLNSVVNQAEVDGEGALPICCCEDQNHICCPNLSESCQPLSNRLCCENGYVECNGECQLETIPCCKGDEFNCQYQNNNCVSYCCCDNTEICCEYTQSCIPYNDLCCPIGQKECNGYCVPENDYCCPPGTSYCSYTRQCEENCCDELSGFYWCEYTNECETDCCPLTTVWCPELGECIASTIKCCPVETPYCIHTDSCEEHCCQYDHNVHDVWCPITGTCEDECDCCSYGTTACLCVSGSYNADTTCYKDNGEECCEDYWCTQSGRCVTDEVSCCESQGFTYVGGLYQESTYDPKYCCDAGSTHYSLGVDGENDIVGCCSYEGPLAYTPTDCCRAPVGDEKEVTFNPTTSTCDVTLYEPCPCEGCCDFNCCDELDYFMHRAFFEHYSSEYGNDFNLFYQEWYNSFYGWWHSPTSNPEY